MGQMKKLRRVAAVSSSADRGPNLYTYTAIAAMLGLMTLLTFVDLSEFLPLQTKDAETIANLAERGVSGDSNSYKATALVYSLLSPSMRSIVTYGLGSGFIVYCLYSLRKPLWLSIMAFMLIGPMIFYLTQFNKDTILLPFVLAAAAITRQNLKHTAKIALIFLVYAVYALAFRPYYFLIGGSVVAFAILPRLSVGLRAFLIFSAIAGSFLLPEEVFYNLQNYRDSVNAIRILYKADAGARTAFMNIVPPDSFYNFLVNYCYAFLRLNMPFLFDFNIKDLFLVANILILIYLFSTAYRSKLDSVRVSGFVFASHFLILQIFEPDLGSYFRHISIALAIAVPAFILAEQRSMATTTIRKVARPARGRRKPIRRPGNASRYMRPLPARSSTDDARI